MRINAGMAQQRIDFVQHFVADRMFEFLGLHVNFAPIQAQRL